MRRPSRVLMSAVVVLSLSGGGYLMRGNLTGGGLAGVSADSVQGFDAGSVLTAVQPALSAPPGTQAAPGAPGSGTPTAGTSPPRAGHPTATKPKPKPTRTTPKPVKTSPPASRSTVDQLLAQINALRAQHGLPAYTLLSGLNASAHKHNLVMLGSCGMSHQCPGEASLGARISAQGVHWSSCGENIGWSGPHADTAAAMVAAAEGLTTGMYNEKPPDDGHRLNLLSTGFHHIGIDVVRGADGRVWVTQDFSS